MKNITRSRINSASLVAILIALVGLFTEQGHLTAAIGGLVVFVINSVVVIVDKFKMTNDWYILGLAILGTVVSILQLIADTLPFPVNIEVLTMVIAALTIIVRTLSKEFPKTA